MFSRFIFPTPIVNFYCLFHKFFVEVMFIKPTLSTYLMNKPMTFKTHWDTSFVGTFCTGATMTGSIIMMRLAWRCAMYNTIQCTYPFEVFLIMRAFRFHLIPAEQVLPILVRVSLETLSLHPSHNKKPEWFL